MTTRPPKALRLTLEKIERNLRIDRFLREEERIRREAEAKRRARDAAELST